MPTTIITEERFRSQYGDIKADYAALLQAEPDDKRWRRFGRLVQRLRRAYRVEKLYAVKYLNELQIQQRSFRGAKNALIVRAIELMQRVILHKKLNRG